MRCYKLIAQCPYPAMRDALSATYKPSTTICKEIGMSYMAFRNIVEGKNLPNLVFAEKMAAYFGSTTDEMFPLDITQKIGGFYG